MQRRAPRRDRSSAGIQRGVGPPALLRPHLELCSGSISRLADAVVGWSTVTRRAASPAAAHALGELLLAQLARARRLGLRLSACRRRSTGRVALLERGRQRALVAGGGVALALPALLQQADRLHLRLTPQRARRQLQLDVVGPPRRRRLLAAAFSASARAAPPPPSRASCAAATLDRAARSSAFARGSPRRAARASSSGVGDGGVASSASPSPGFDLADRAVLDATRRCVRACPAAWRARSAAARVCSAASAR